MFRSLLLLSIGATLYANSDYVPFSKFTQSEQIEHNFKKVEVNNTKNIEIAKPIVPRVTKKVKTNDVVKEKILHTNKNQIKKQKHTKKTVYKQDILYSARLTYSPLTANYSSSLLDTSDTSNSVEPSGSVSFGNHKIEANYFKSENEFSSNKAETTWYKLAYKYNYENVNIGFGANHVSIDRNNNDIKETFPSLEIDFKNSSGLLDLEYGASLGKNKNIDYSYEYFINLNIKPYENSNLALVLGYKNRTIEKDNEKIEFTTPLIGINTVF